MSVDHPWAYVSGVLSCLAHPEPVALVPDGLGSYCPSCGWQTWMQKADGKIPGEVRAPVPPIT